MRRNARISQPPSCIIALFSPDTAAETAMEAEQLNAIARRLSDLSQRNTELRRYL